MADRSDLEVHAGDSAKSEAKNSLPGKILPTLHNGIIEKVLAFTAYEARVAAALANHHAFHYISAILGIRGYVERLRGGQRW